MLVVNDRIVWKGPVYLRPSKNSQATYFNGTWPVTFEDGRSGTLVADRGTLRMSVAGSFENCSFDMSPRGKTGGSWAIKCFKGVEGSGSYEVQSAIRETRFDGTIGQREVSFTTTDATATGT